MGTCNTEECCPRFEPGPWDETELNWDKKLFVKDHVTSWYRSNVDAWPSLFYEIAFHGGMSRCFSISNSQHSNPISKCAKRRE